jgi:hypothetical protein
MENSKGRAIYIIIIILLLIGNGVFGYLYFNKEKEVVTVEEKLLNTDNARKELEDILSQTKTELGKYVGENEELDSIINERNAEIQAKADEIKSLLRKNQISAAELLRVKDELDVLRYYNRKYTQQVDSIARENEILVENLQATKKTLNKANAKIEDLTMENIEKDNKLNIASRLKADNFTVVGIQNRSSGRLRETTRAKRVDQIKVEFVIEDNPTAQLGDRNIYMRLLNPDGATISTETSGGGKFEYMGSEALYTQRQKINFKNEQPTITFYYARGNTEWEKGEYTVLLYSDGFLIGSKKFTLR